MAKKSIRLLSLLLAVLMLISMVPVAVAQTVDTDVITDADHREILYDKLVGEKNQKSPTYDVYVVDDNWNIKEADGVKTVTFNFRGQAVTEVYDETRHLTSVDAVYTQAAADGVTGSKIPVCILTEGNYSTQIKLKTSIWLLGAKAGYNPVVPSAGVDIAWDMSAERKLPDIGSANTQGETRIWAGLGLAETDFPGMNSTYSDMNLKLINTTQTSGEQEYVLDGIVFQGYGATLADTGAGSGSRTYFLQNVIFNNGYSYDCDQIRFWNRSGNFTASKSLNIYNSYLTGNNNLGFYSGHASKIQVNGLCAQNNYAYLFRAQTMQVQGMRFEMRNSHFWRSREFASDVTPRNVARNDAILNCNFTSPANHANQIGNNTEAYHYAISNSTFWNANSVTEYYGNRLQNSSALFMVGMAGTDEKIIMEGNVFGSDFQMAEGESRHPLQIRYLKATGGVYTGEITHAGTAITNISAIDSYALTSDMVQIHNNTFISSMYQNTVPDIGDNTTPGTKIEMTGNFHAETLSTRNGTYAVGSFDDVVYDKWVYLKNTEDAMADPKNKTDFIEESAFTFDAPEETLVAAGDRAYTIDTDAKAVKLTYTAGADSTYTNYVEVYAADSDFNKLANVTGTATETTVEFSNSVNYFVVSLLSIDKRTAVDHYITINRGIQQAAKLEGITPADQSLVVEENLNNFYYELDHAADTFEFTLDIPEATGSYLFATNAKGEKVRVMPKSGTNHTYVISLNELNTVYEYELGVSLVDILGVYDEEYTLSFLRRYSSDNEVKSMTVNPGTVTKDAANYVFNAAAAVAQKAMSFTPVVADTATLEVIDMTYNKVITASAGTYAASDLKLEDNFYQLIVTAQDGSSATWTLVINRPADTNANLKSIQNAAKGSDGNYTTNVTTDKFIVAAEAESASAKVEIFADKNCTDPILDPAITLLNKSVNVWIKVTAEAGNSTVTMLTINTTTTGSTGGTKYPMQGNGIIGVTGAEPFAKDAAEIVVKLGADAKDYPFKAIGLSGYSVAIYGDAKHTLWAPTEMSITPDSGETYLYAVAKSPDGKDVRSYKIVIKSTITVKYSDTAVEWAKTYVNKLRDSGMGYIKGNERGQFNGDANLNRYEMATMMVRITGANKDLYANVKLPFRDVDTIPTWAQNYVKAAFRIGLVGGHAILDDAGKVIAYEYKGDDNATRSEFLKVFMNAMYGEDVGEIYNKLTQQEKDALAKKITDMKFADQADIQEWAIPYVYYAINDGVIKGAGDRINPNMNIIRYEAAAIICRKYFGMA